MKQRIVTSNVRFPYQAWLAVKAAAAEMNMSINEYFQYLVSAETIKTLVGIPQVKSRPMGYAALDKFIHRKITGKPMGASDEDKAIYGIED